MADSLYRLAQGAPSLCPKGGPPTYVALIYGQRSTRVTLMVFNGAVAWRAVRRASAVRVPLPPIFAGEQADCAVRVTNADELRSVADEYVRLGWPAHVDGDALTAEYSAPSAGPPPWHVYRVMPSTVYAFGTAEPGGATRFDLTQ